MIRQLHYRKVTSCCVCHARNIDSQNYTETKLLVLQHQPWTSRPKHSPSPTRILGLKKRSFTLIVILCNRIIVLCNGFSQSTSRQDEILQAKQVVIHSDEYVEGLNTHL